MADRIRVLPDPVANQIAAGEVVNRPSSVVKEMMENAIDAGSRNVTVSFTDGGKESIKIIDDGCGMSSNDARMAFERHATSKITDVEDIYKLRTFGFRGEALASIASVAEIELRTRQADQELGVQIELAGGRFVKQTPVNCPVGSQFTIRNLFFNVPARRRFLEKSSTEARHIVAEYQRVALCNPEIGFALYDNDSLISKLPPSSLRQRIVGVIGKNIGKNLLEVSADTSIVKVRGFAGRPASARQNNKEQFLFVNGRYFKSPYFNKAIVSGYDKLIPGNTQPSYFIYLEIDTEKIDVNVHPQKTEVKFTDGSDIWQIINAAIRETLAKSGAVPSMDFDIDQSVEIPMLRDRVIYKAPSISANPEFNPFEKYPDAGEADPMADRMPIGKNHPTGPGRMAADFDCDPFPAEYTSRPEEMIPDEQEYLRSVIEYVGGEDIQQKITGFDTPVVCSIMPVGNRYFATISQGSLVLVDIGRAREALLYERYMEMLRHGSSISQQLMFPETVVMSNDDLGLLREHLEEINGFGFDISVSEDLSVGIKAVPADFTGVPAEKLLYELLDMMQGDVEPDGELRRKKLAAALSKAGSWRSSGTLSKDELSALWEQLNGCSNPSFTPQGLPVMAALSEDEIGRLLKK